MVNAPANWELELCALAGYVCFVDKINCTGYRKAKGGKLQEKHVGKRPTRRDRYGQDGAINNISVYLGGGKYEIQSLAFEILSID